MKNILVSIDFEEQVPRLLEQAEIFARTFNSKIWLLHISEPDPDFIGYEVGPQNVRDVRADELKQEKDLIENFAADLRARGIEAAGYIIEGPTVGTILKQIKKFEIDLIRRALEQTGGHQSRAARLLGLNATTLNSKIKSYNIDLSGIRTS